MRVWSLRGNDLSFNTVDEFPFKHNSRYVTNHTRRGGGAGCQHFIFMNQGSATCKHWRCHGNFRYMSRLAEYLKTIEMTRCSVRLWNHSQRGTLISSNLNLYWDSKHDESRVKFVNCYFRWRKYAIFTAKMSQVFSVLIPSYETSFSFPSLVSTHLAYSRKVSIFESFCTAAFRKQLTIPNWPALVTLC